MIVYPYQVNSLELIGDIDMMMIDLISGVIKSIHVQLYLYTYMYVAGFLLVLVAMILETKSTIDS